MRKFAAALLAFAPFAATAAIPSLLLRSEDENRLVRESAVRTLHQIDPVAVAKARV